MQVYLVTPEVLGSCWAEVAPVIAKAVPSAGGRYELYDIHKELIVGSQQLWVAKDERGVVGVVTTEIKSYPMKRMLVGLFAAGEDIQSWIKPMLALLDKWAIDNLCAGFEMTGRDGWKRMLAPYGWKKVYSVYEKEYPHDGQRIRIGHATADKLDGHTDEPT